MWAGAGEHHPVQRVGWQHRVVLVLGLTAHLQVRRQVAVRGPHNGIAVLGGEHLHAAAGGAVVLGGRGVEVCRERADVGLRVCRLRGSADCRARQFRSTVSRLAGINWVRRTGRL